MPSYLSSVHSPKPCGSSVLTVRPQQKAAVEFCVNGDYALIVADTGAGKTLTGIHAVNEALGANIISRCIVTCPPNIIKSWTRELDRATDCQHTRYVVLDGTPAQRLSLLDNNATVLIISMQNLDWLLQQKHGCDGIIVDEIPKYTGKSAKRLTHKKVERQITWRVGLTATPASENYLKLFDMVRLLDGGDTFGRNKQKWLNQYFMTTDYHQRNWVVRDTRAESELLSKVASVSFHMTSNKEADLPKTRDSTMTYTLPAITQQAYIEMLKHSVIESNDIAAANEAVKSGKLRQLCTGSVIDTDSECIVEYDTDRRRCVKAWANALDNGVVFYEFGFQKDAIIAALEGYTVVSIFGGISSKEKQARIERFTEGKAQFLVAQAACISHGVDGLQRVCADALYYAPIWSNDLNHQSRGRLYRTGQTRETTFTTIVASGTIEELVVLRVLDKKEYDKRLREYLNA